MFSFHNRAIVWQYEFGYCTYKYSEVYCQHLRQLELVATLLYILIFFKFHSGATGLHYEFGCFTYNEVYLEHLVFLTEVSWASKRVRISGLLCCASGCFNSTTKLSVYFMNLDVSLTMMRHEHLNQLQQAVTQLYIWIFNSAVSIGDLFIWCLWCQELLFPMFIMFLKGYEDSWLWHNLAVTPVLQIYCIFYRCESTLYLGGCVHS
jgi:hypothetical protein